MRTRIHCLIRFLTVVLLLGHASMGLGQTRLEGRVYEGQTGVEPPPWGDAKALVGVTVNLYGANDAGQMGTYITSATTGSDGWYGLSFLTRNAAYDFYNIVAMRPAGYVSQGATSVSGEVKATDWIQYEFIELAQTTTGNKFWFLPEMVVPENRPPVANDDSAATVQDRPVTIPVLDNDSDPDGDPLTISWVDGPANGTATHNGKVIVYTPGPGFIGFDAFGYTVSDGAGGTSSAVCTVHVTSAGATVSRLRHTVAGTVYEMIRGNQSGPMRGLRVNLQGSHGVGGRDVLLATDHTGPDGRFKFAALLGEQWEFPFLVLSVGDAAYTLVAVTPGPGSEVVGGSQIRIPVPGPGDYDGNAFYVKRSGSAVPQIAPPNLISMEVAGCPATAGPQPTPPVTDLSILGIEVTQAIQCFDKSKGYTNCPDNGLELTIGKPTAVRVYVGHEGGPSCPSGQPDTAVLNGVCVKLTWAVVVPGLPAGAGVLGQQAEQSFAVSCSKQLDQLREKEGGSATFLLQPGVLDNGKNMVDFLFEAQVTAPGIAESNQNNNVKEVTVSFARRNPLNVTGIRVYYNPYQPIVPIKNPLADYAQVAQASEFMERVYPVPVNYQMYPNNTWLLYGDNPATPGKEQTYHQEVYFDEGYQLLVLLDSYYDNMSPKPDVLVGWLPTPPSSVSPNIWGGSYTPSNQAWLFQLPTPDLTGKYLAHEIGHTRGLKHVVTDTYGNADKCAPGTTILETGYDTGSYHVRSASTDDLMKDYVGDWISPYVWNRLLGKQPSSTWSVCSAVAAADLRPVMLISGRVHSNGTAEFDAPYVVESENPIQTSAPAGDYYLELRSSVGSPLFTCRLDLPFETPMTGTPLPASGFNATLPYEPAARRLVLRRGPTVLAARDASPYAPTVTIGAPRSGSVVEGVTRATWTASDRDGDPLRFRVLYSPDDGASWLPLVLDTDATGLDLDSGALPGGDEARIRVLASDGFNTTSCDSAPFHVARKAPSVFITRPQDGSSHHVRLAITLTGHAEDFEDGVLSGASLVWTSDRQGVLGSGAQIILPGTTLDVGVHEITLTATDSDGQTGMASALLLVHGDDME